MAVGNSVSLELLQKELERARGRLFSQNQLVKEAQDALAYAVREKLKATEATIRAKLPRVQAAASVTKGVVEELEKAVGTLPMK